MKINKYKKGNYKLTELEAESENDKELLGTPVKITNIISGYWDHITFRNGKVIGIHKVTRKSPFDPEPYTSFDYEVECKVGRGTKVFNALYVFANKETFL